MVVERRRRTSGERLLRAFTEARGDLLQRLALHLGNADDAQDAAQETFLKCWRSRDGLRQVRDLRAWIFRVGLNAARDLQRNAWRRKSRPLPDLATQGTRLAVSPSDHLLHQETLDRLRMALLNLRPEERQVFLFRQNTALTYEEIAARQNLPVGTIKTQMRSALLKLRAVLGEADPLDRRTTG